MPSVRAVCHGPLSGWSREETIPLRQRSRGAGRRRASSARLPASARRSPAVHGGDGSGARRDRHDGPDPHLASRDPGPSAAPGATARQAFRPRTVACLLVAADHARPRGTLRPPGGCGMASRPTCLDRLVRRSPPRLDGVASPTSSTTCSCSAPSRKALVIGSMNRGGCGEPVLKLDDRFTGCRRRHHRSSRPRRRQMLTRICPGRPRQRRHPRASGRAVAGSPPRQNGACQTFLTVRRDAGASGLLGRLGHHLDRRCVPRCRRRTWLKIPVVDDMGAESPDATTLPYPSPGR